MLNKIIGLLILLSTVSVSYADEIQVNPERPDKYVVQKGDTLWDIAGRFLQQPWRWPDIWKGNPQIQDPNLIFPGDVVSLTFEGGVPVLSAARGAGGRNEKWSPEIRSHDDPEPIPSIPLNAIQQFLLKPLVLSEGEIGTWPYVVASYGQHLVSGKGSKIYVRGLSGAGDRYYVYRKGPAYRSGTSNEILGYEALYVGEVQIEKSGDPATAIVTDSAREVLEGDRLVAVSSGDMESDFTPRSPKGKVSGNIISVVDGLSEIGQYQVVVLDVGTGNGIEVGNVLGVYQAGQVMKDRVKNGDDVHPLIDYLGTYKWSGDDVILPQEYAGVVMVFRTFSKVSYALVMEASGPLNINDAVRNL